MAIIKYTFKHLSGRAIEQIEESIASHVGKDNVSVIALNKFDHCMTITISDDADIIFHIGTILGHYEVCVTHGLITPRKVKIYGNEYKKTYTLENFKTAHQ